MSTDTGIKRKLCRELPREKGESFEVWNKELLDAAHGEGDEDASWAETYLGQDPRGGLTPAQTRRRAQRNRQAGGIACHAGQGEGSASGGKLFVSVVLLRCACAADETQQNASLRNFF